jgi:hypothetical protein
MTASRLMAIGLTTAGLLLIPTHAALSATKHAKPPTTTSTEPAVEPDSLKALRDMSAYLRTLNSFEITAKTVREEVDDAGQKLQFTGATTYEVRRPNGFVIKVAEDRKIRDLYYNGSSLTLFAPRMNFYTKVSAPHTIRETMDFMAEHYDVRVPLADLFKWGQGDDGSSKITRGYYVGYAKIDGQDADQFAYRQEAVDWQIWIARGDKPVPLRVVITGTQNPAQPQFEADLSWNLAPQYTDATFTFQPPPDAKLISIASAK